MDNQWWYQTLGEEFGPVSLDTIQELIVDGLLGAGDLVRQGTESPWVSIQQARGPKMSDSPQTPTAKSSRGGTMSDPQQQPVVSRRAIESGMAADRPTGSEHGTHWYCRESSTEWGPLTAEQMCNGIQQGTITSDTEVKRGSSGRWTRADDVPELFTQTAVRDSSQSTHQQEHSRDAGSPVSTHGKEVSRAIAECYASLRQRDRRLHKTFRHRRPAATGWNLFQWLPSLSTAARAVGNLLAWIFGKLSFLRPLLKSKALWGTTLIVAVLIAAFTIYRNWYSPQSAYVELQQLATEFKSLRDHAASETEWEDFSDRADHELAQLARKLSNAAQADDPVSMELLWAARDYFPKMLTDSKRQPGPGERKFDLHLKRAETLLRMHRPTESSQPDWLIVGVTAIDLLLIIAGGLWWWKQ